MKLFVIDFQTVSGPAPIPSSFKVLTRKLLIDAKFIKIEACTTQEFIEQLHNSVNLHKLKSLKEL